MTPLYFVTYEAPPHIGENLPENGAAICALRKVFTKINYDLRLTFAPLKRAKNLAATKEEYTGYFPSSPYDVDPQFEASKALLQSPWVIAERKDKPIVWNKISDLAKYRGGTVTQYTPPTEIENLIKTGSMIVEGAPDDIMNMQKLVSKRIDYAFIDSTMFDYLVTKDERFIPYAKNLRANPKTVELVPYYMAFKKSAAAKKVLREFNQHFDQEKFVVVYKECLKKYMK